MNIWIMRHGEAGFNAPSDSQRALTEQGKNTAKKQGEWLGKILLEQGASLDKVIVSPYLRAQQTLEQLSEGLQAVGFPQKIANLIEAWEGITPDGSLNTVMDYLEFLKEEGAKQVLIVSHLPLVFDLVSALTQHQQSVHFYPAVIANVDWTTAIGEVKAVGMP